MYLHCEKCHHEWEVSGISDSRYYRCTWCGGGSYVLEGKTPLEKMIPEIDGLIEKLRSYKDPYTDKVADKIEESKKG